MSLRVKWVLVLVGLTVLASAAVGLLSYRVTAAQLDAEVNRSLVAAVEDVESVTRRPGRPRPGPLVLAGSDEVYLQYVRSNGSVVTPEPSRTIPVDQGDLVLATDAPRGARELRDDEIDGEAVRVLTVAMGNGRGALQAARGIEETNRVLASLRSRILMVSVGVAAVAAVAGVLIGGSVTRRLSRLSAVAEGVAATGGLDAGVPVEGSDEVARLGQAFNDMLTELALSEAEQARLVQDAGHELRTPMTSLRTNIFTLRRFSELDEATRLALIGDLEAESEELSSLIDEVLQVSSGASAQEPLAGVDVGALVAEVAKRTGARWNRGVNVEADDGIVMELRERQVGRAVRNMVDNACKFSPEGSPVDVMVRRGPVPDTGDGHEGVTIEVRDRGPGFEEQDLNHVFAGSTVPLAARSLPGSGLQALHRRDGGEAHRGRVRAVNRDGGGADVMMWLPVVQDGGES
ncbi:MAG: HAMP domain-containing histidine kinase [Microthrixaceae bacterium]|nr:HAMP domain-containing histidine kinase [Microthrixaceae bacterium]